MQGSRGLAEWLAPSAAGVVFLLIVAVVWLDVERRRLLGLVKETHETLIHEMKAHLATMDRLYQVVLRARGKEQ